MKRSGCYQYPKKKQMSTDHENRNHCSTNQWASETHDKMATGVQGGWLEIFHLGWWYSEAGARFHSL